MAASNVRITNELRTPSEIGTHFRFLCMTGPNKGKVYYLTGKRILIGRGENVDIQILDTKISREHAELSFSDNSYTITDMGAQNGVIVNDNRIKQAKLNEGEKVVIGQTVFKYNVIVVRQSTEMMLAEASPDSALAKDIKKGVRPTVALKRAKNHLEEEINAPRSAPTPEADNKSRFLIIGVVLFAVVFVLFGGDEKSKTKKS
ncbi:MAG: FHA domain-containing protein, partial [Bdellovibrionales bacterium]|nr:FHA domain-containing protein [Bdellovibrionales bacterium]